MPSLNFILPHCNLEAKQHFQVFVTCMSVPCQKYFAEVKIYKNWIYPKITENWESSSTNTGESDHEEIELEKKHLRTTWGAKQNDVHLEPLNEKIPNLT